MATYRELLMQLEVALHREADRVRTLPVLEWRKPPRRLEDGSWSEHWPKRQFLAAILSGCCLEVEVVTISEAEHLYTNGGFNAWWITNGKDNQLERIDWIAEFSEPPQEASRCTRS